MLAAAAAPVNWPSLILTSAAILAATSIAVILGYRITVDIVQPVGKIPIVDDEGMAGADDLFSHLVDRGDKRVLEHLEGHRIERKIRPCNAHREASPKWMIMFNHAPVSARLPGGTSTVESNCSITSGPAITAPAGRSSWR